MEPPAADEPPRQENPEPANYGRTPDTAIPYRNFTEPYRRFFEEQIEFLGSGREKAPPADLEAVPIGFFAPAGSAPDADLGQYMLEGATLAIERANAEDGYRGIPFELVLREDLGLWGASSNEMVAFRYEDEVVAVIGSIDGANTHIALRAALKIQMPMVNTGTTDPTLTETRIPWLLRCMADDRQQGYALAYHIIEECGLEKIVALRVNDRYGRTGIAEFRDAARRLKDPLRAELRWDRGEREFGSQLERIAALAPEAIVVWGNAADTAALVREIRRRGIPVRIFGSDRLASPAFLEAAGPAAEGVVAAATWDPTRDDPKLRAFAESFARRFDHPPEAFAAHAYDGTRILIEAVHEGGLNRVAIRDALHQFASYEGVSGPIVFDTTLNDIGPVYLATVRKGRFQYRRFSFEKMSQAERGVAPYRRLAESPPAARSPERLGAHGNAPRIGCFLPLDETGQAVVRGIREALAEDRAAHPAEPAIELIVRDARGGWGQATSGLVEMVMDESVLAVIGSTERTGTHLIETLAAKLHLSVVALCGEDPTITQIPLPWVFCVAPSRVAEADAEDGAALGYDAAAVTIGRIRAGARSRRGLRDALAGGDWHRGRTGTFRFDGLGNRREWRREPSSAAEEG
jgi:ABC-type branched-subunit amino acid transport system substrate-binding protein